MALAQDNLEQYTVAYAKAVNRLHKVHRFFVRCSMALTCTFSLSLNKNMHPSTPTTKYLRRGFKSNYFVCYSIIPPQV